MESRPRATEDVAGRRFALAAGILCSLVIGAASLAVVWSATEHGIRLSRDSYAYVGTARSIAGGRGFARPYGEHLYEPETRIPPLYPAALAVGRLSGRDPLQWARPLTALLFAALVATAGVAVLGATRSALAAAAISLVVATAVPLLHVTLWAWSEPLFLVLEAATLGLLAWAVRRGGSGPAALAGAAAAAAALTRYVGLTLAPVGVLALALGSRRERRGRTLEAVTFAVAALAPVGAWLLRNAVSGGSAVGRSVGFAPVGGERRNDAADTLAGWAARLDGPAPIGRWWIAAAAATVVCSLAATALAGRRRPLPRLPALAWIALLFLGCYALLLLAAVTTIAQGVHFTERILSPAYLALAVGTVTFVWWLCHAPLRFRLGIRAAAILALAVVVGGGVSEVHEWRDAARAWTPFYATAAWRHSALAARVAALPERVTVASNLSAQLMIASGRAVVQVPLDGAPVAPLRGVLGRRGVVAYVTGRLRRGHRDAYRAPSRRELAGALGLVEVWRGSGGVLLARGSPLRSPR